MQSTQITWLFLYSTEYSSNVAYREIDVDVPIAERKFVPYLWAKPAPNLPRRFVVLVATRDIQADEELFSDYFTLVTNKNKSG